MDTKESEKPESKGFLSKEAMKELRSREATRRENTAKTQKILDRTLPFASGRTRSIRVK